MQEIPRDSIISANPETNDQPMRGYVKGSQLDRNGDSGCPMLLQNSGWDPETAALRINPNDESNRLGVRPFFPVIMEAVPSHQDLQPTRGEAFLRNYFTKYRSNFSDSMVEECMNDDADANSLAVNVLMRYRPFEPEMVLQLFGKIFRQWEVSTHQGGKRDFVVPLPDADVWPNVIHMYNGSHLGARKTNAQGQIVDWLCKKIKASEATTSLENFAQAYTVKGEKLWQHQHICA